MREIKFEVWDPNAERMYKNIGIDTIGHYDFQGDAITEQEALVIRQYTGLKDKNGKEIYEGDILYDSVKSIEAYSEVKWELEMGRFEAWGRNLWVRCGRTEVIGNIYENADQFPHLLEGRDEA